MTRWNEYNIHHRTALKKPDFGIFIVFNCRHMFKMIYILMLFLQVRGETEMSDFC